MNADQRLTNISKQRARINGSPGRPWTVATVAAAVLLVGVIFLLVVDGGRLKTVWQHMETQATEANSGAD